MVYGVDPGRMRTDSRSQTSLMCFRQSFAASLAGRRCLSLAESADSPPLITGAGRTLGLRRRLWPVFGIGIALLIGGCAVKPDPAQTPFQLPAAFAAAPG